MSINIEASLTSALPDDWQRDMVTAIQDLELAAKAYTDAGDAYVSQMKAHTEAKRAYEDAYARAHLETKAGDKKMTAPDIAQQCVIDTIGERRNLSIAYVMKESARTARESAEMILKTRQSKVDALRGVGFLLLQEMKQFK